jgi:hypothetical protein
MSFPKTTKLEDLIFKYLRLDEDAGFYLEAKLEEEGIVGLQRGISQIIAARQLAVELTMNPLQDLEMAKSWGLDPALIDQLKAEVLRQQPLPRSA